MSSAVESMAPTSSVLVPTSTISILPTSTESASVNSTSTANPGGTPYFNTSTTIIVILIMFGIIIVTFIRWRKERTFLAQQRAQMNHLDAYGRPVMLQTGSYGNDHVSVVYLSSPSPSISRNSRHSQMFENIHHEEIEDLPRYQDHNNSSSEIHPESPVPSISTVSHHNSVVHTNYSTDLPPPYSEN